MEVIVEAQDVGVPEEKTVIFNNNALPTDKLN